MIVTVTFNPAVDHTVRLDRDMEPETILRSGEQRFDAGGKGINVAAYLTALDVDAVATGPLGGFTGRFVRDDLSRADIPTDFVEIDRTTRLNTTVAAADGEYKINHDGPALGTDAVDAVHDRIAAHDPATVVVAGSLPPGLDTAAIDRVADGPWETVVDAHGDALASLNGRYALCKPNREELAGATGMPTGTRREVVDAALSLREEGFEAVLASMGSDGAVLVDADGALHADAQADAVVDTTGAGDAILAGFLAARAAGGTRTDALRTGVMLAGRVVETAGTGIPDLAGFDEAVENVAVTEP